MGDILSSAEGDTTTIECELVTDNNGKFAGLAPVDFGNPAEGREKALKLAEHLVARNQLAKNFDPTCHTLKIPGVPEGAVDIGLHCSTHNEKFHGGRLTPEQMQAIEECKDTFTLTVDLKNFKVLVGSPSNDAPTGVVGYVGLLIKPESLREYNRAVDVYKGIQRDDNIPHVSICGWNLNGFDNTTEARKAFGLVTEDKATYPDGNSYYTANIFPSRCIAPGEAENIESPEKKARPE